MTSGHYYSQGLSSEELETIEGIGNLHLNQEKLATSFYLWQVLPQFVSGKEKNFWQKNDLFRQYLIKLIKQLMS
jgi:hypothetical protein